MGYIYWDGFWRCRDCGYVNPPEEVQACACGRERTYEMTYTQARAVARKLKRLEGELKETTYWLKALNAEAERMHEKQSCGHERRFIIGTGDDHDWCALCLLKKIQEHPNSVWIIDREEATDETD